MTNSSNLKAGERATIRPFASKPAVVIIAPCSARELCQKLNLDIDINANTVSYRKQTALSCAVSIVAGRRKPRESAEKFAARAQTALNQLVGITR